MTAHPQTAPFLLYGLLRYTPPHLKAFQHVSELHCDHVYSTSTERSFLPELDERPSTGKVWKVEAICQNCRIHITLSIDFANTPEQACPCPDFPIHHFILDEQFETEQAHSFQFRCGSPLCKAQLDAQLRAPALSEIDKWILTDPVGLKQRWKKCYERGEAEPYTPAKALSTFRSYVNDAITSDTPKRIPTHNKRFMLALGDDAAVLLARLGFTAEPAREGSPYPLWRLPGPGPYLDDQTRTQLQDVFDELLVLMQQRPDAEKQKAGEPVYRPPPSTKDMGRILGCLDYDRYTSPTRGTQTRSQDLNYSFSKLGALSDYADSLISYCFDRQHMWDPENTPLYYQCLRDIASSRQSETLVQKAHLLESQGYLSQTDIQQAYQYFGIKPELQSSRTDEQLLDLYQSRVPDVGREEQARARAALSKIGQVRNSSLLKNASSDKIHSYDQALAFLGAEKSTEDTFILTLAQLKASDNTHNAQLAQEAVQLIAQHRNSDVLRQGHYAASGRNTMTPQYAYRLLGVDNPENADDEGIVISHQVAVQDHPHRATEFNDALLVIAEQRNSQHLRYQLSSMPGQDVKIQSSSVTTSAWHVPPQEEPRGLNNIGNTCYLNSLLQYLFTVKPVRDMIENFDDHKQILPDDNSAFEKRVADMKVDKDGVRRTQAFVHELGKLFHALTTSRAACATPEVELARLTLEKAGPVVIPEEAEQKVQSPINDPKRRRSTMSGHALTLSKIRSTSVGSIVTSPTIEHRGYSDEATSSSPPKKSRTSSNVSATSTLVPDDAKTKAGEWSDDAEHVKKQMVSQEDRQRQSEDFMNVDRQNEAKFVNEGDTPTDSKPSSSNVDELSDTTKERPPPIPPRPVGKQQIEQYAMQQDVEEVMGNVFHQLQWAIKPQNVTADGNQEDVISKIFWGKSTEHSVYQSGKQETQTNPFHNLFVYANEPCDMYEALSTSLDREVVDDRAVFWTIDEAPPIMHFIVPRVLWDAEKSTEVRNTNQLKLDPYIYLDRFMADDRMIRERQLFWRYRDELRKRKTQKERLKPVDRDLSVPEQLDSLRDYLKDLKANDDDLDIGLPADDAQMHEFLDEQAREIEGETKKLDDEIFEFQDRMKGLFRSEGRRKYCLQTVFVHRGSARSGHWFTYMYDARGNRWRKYNDEEVVVVDNSRLEAEIFSPDESVRGAATVVVYASEEQRDDLFEPVHRQPDAEPEPAPAMEQQPVRSQTGELPPTNTPYPGASTSEHREPWDQDRVDVADSGVKW